MKSHARMSAKLSDQPETSSSENDSTEVQPSILSKKVNRRGFIERTTALAVAAFAGFVVSTDNKAASALSLCEVDPAACTTTPAPINYTARNEGTVNDIVSAFNAHNASAVVSYFGTSGIDSTLLETELNNVFTAFPAVTLTVTSMTAGYLGETITIDYEINGEYNAAVDDVFISASGVPVNSQNDTATGSNTFYFNTAGEITENVGSSNHVQIFESYGAKYIGPPS